MGVNTKIFKSVILIIFLFPLIIQANLLRGVGDGTVKPGTVSNSVSPQNAEVLEDAELKFNAIAMNDKVELNWSSAHQKNTNYYELERSLDGVEWILIDKQKAAENCRVALYYEAKDKEAPNELCFYRVKTVYLDGTERFSEYAGVDRGNKKEYLIYFLNGYPNYYLNFVYSGNIKEVNYEIIHSCGKKMDFLITQVIENKITFDMNGALPGEYSIKLKAASGKEVNGSVWISKQE